MEVSIDLTVFLDVEEQMRHYSFFRLIVSVLTSHFILLRLDGK